MSINDPQWGNSHRPEQNDPEQVPESTGTEPVQPDNGAQDLRKSPPSGTPPRPPQPPEGPPDLEVLWQQLVYKIRCRVARLLGRELPAPPELAPVAPVSSASPVFEASSLTGWQALSLKSWLIGVTLIVGAWLVSGFYLVDPQQRGVLSRFGRIVAVEDAGWHWRWPYPVDTVRLINVSADRTLEVGLSAQKGRRQAQGQMLTADGGLVSVAYAIVYQVVDPVAYLSRAETPTDLLALQAESALREVVAQQSTGDLLSVASRQAVAIRAPMQARVRDRLQTAMDPLQMGVVVKGLEIRDVQLPPQVLQSIKEFERDEQARIRALRDAQMTSTESLIKARKLAAQLQEENAAYVRALDAEAQAVQTAGGKTDVGEARQALSRWVTALRQQYPLVVASAAALRERAQGMSERGRSGASANPTAENLDASRPTSGEWRNREIMRSRDRVDRPGSGS